MKRKIRLLLVMALVLSGILAGCGNSADRVVSDTSAEQDTATKQDASVEQENGAQSEGSLKTGLALTADISGSKDAGEAEGTAQADIMTAAVTVDADGKIVSCSIDSAQVQVNFDKNGKITTDLTGEVATKQELGEAYGMKNASAIGKEWNEQADAFAAYCVGKTSKEVEGIAVTEAGKAADADLAASCSINIGSFQDIVVKAVNNAK